MEKEGEREQETDGNVAGAQVEKPLPVGRGPGRQQSWPGGPGRRDPLGTKGAQGRFRHELECPSAQIRTRATLGEGLAQRPSTAATRHKLHRLLPGLCISIRRWHCPTLASRLIWYPYSLRTPPRLHLADPELMMPKVTVANRASGSLHSLTSTQVGIHWVAGPS